MSKFFLALLFGMLQVILTDQLICAVNKHKIIKTLFFTALKLGLYAVYCFRAIRQNFWEFDMIAYGFIVGVPIMAIVLYITKYLYREQIMALIKTLIQKIKKIKFKQSI